ncbi:hypothetical protein SAMCFNEI73_pC1397 (plasmid) [Sinorhizobium americanum]|uniref:Uncharacterized protein n=1 Tax=Sinorhizobium americanum TaxID=194963 RepID=A0A1L3LYD3_9HYPH|nr:hypothetical protein SAMCFNEI73_pC1397 [Sinorhizobium americanum]
MMVSGGDSVGTFVAQNGGIPNQMTDKLTCYCAARLIRRAKVAAAL